MLAELEFLFMKKGDAERDIGEPECERTMSDARREVVGGKAGEPALGEPDGVAMEANDVSANRGGGSNGSTFSAVSGSDSASCSGRISASAGGNS